MGIQDRIKEIENEMARTQRNKKTEHHFGVMKARLAKLKQDLLIPKSIISKTDTFEVMKDGDARVSLIGFPSVGKSTLLSKITSTESKAAEYEFTTLTCVAGKLNYNGTNIQILDLPGIICGASQGIGRGKQVIGVARTADLILIVLDPLRLSDKKVLENELYSMGIRLNKNKPDISLTITQSGGININFLIKQTNLTEPTVTGILKEYKINNCIMIVREDVTDDDIIDILTNRAVYVPCLFCYNKIDNLTLQELENLNLDENSFALSSQRDWNLEELKEEIWYRLGIKRVYTKRKGCFPDLNLPVILRKSCTVKDFCKNIHRDFVDNFKFALIWGASAKHNPQKVGLNHELCDEDVVRVYTI
ncbi:small GTP-binding protein [Hamiltosporidium magnivora]|uniref:Small GTP-binding protein n=2 Tax=Hamiltosporidium TaxID=1176354 RepID=A0A4Q9L7Y0_9MICR|nr:small GTP-binding protein [Hamiltosporidium magnivora]TBU02189.1 small GTP-binding protein [Hamiltosporidium magnivora]TBU02800.1 small GTP-binding protein [Hamiltosporidium magnivora]